MGRNNRHWHKKPQRPVSDYQPPYAADVLAMSVEGLNLSAETLEILQKGGITTVGHIVSRRKNDMYKVQNFNKKRLFEVVNAIAPLGVDFRPDENAGEGKEDGRERRNGNERNDRQNSENKGSGERRDGDNRGGERRKEGRKDDRMQENKPREDRDRERSRRDEKAPSDERRQGREDRRDDRREDDRRDDRRDKQGDKQGNNKNGKQNNAVDFSKIFPREKLVHSPRIEPEKDIFTKFQRAGKWGFKDQNGKEVIPPIYTEALSFKEDMAAVEMNGLFGYINRENVLVIPYKYDTAGSFSEGWANVTLGEKCGYVDKTGREMVPFIYDAATPFTGEGYGRVKKDGRWGNIRKDGEVSWQ